MLASSIQETMASKHEQKIRENDYQTGLNAELDIWDKLRKQGNTITRTDTYNPFDCKINNKYLGEVKKRTNTKNRFPTTILPYSKLLEYKKVKKQYRDLILIFSFRDGDYYTTYRDLCRNKVEYGPLTRKKGYTHQTRTHVFIPVSLLKPLDQLVLS